MIEKQQILSRAVTTAAAYLELDTPVSKSATTSQLAPELLWQGLY